MESKLKLFLTGILKFLLGVVIVGVLLFVPAGSFEYWNAWLLMGLLFIPMFIVGVILLFKNPELLRLRLKAKEKEKDQKLVILLSGIMFVLGFVAAGLDYRFEYLTLPYEVVIIATVLVVSYIIYGFVLKENTYLSRTIEVQKDQKLVDTGLYGLVRHPMYLATLLLFATMPLVLGSVISFIIFLAYPFIILKRIDNEEKVLEKELKGYKEYKKKVKYKLIPFVW